jgi:hypothetical protein
VKKEERNDVTASLVSTAIELADYAKFDKERTNMVASAGYSSVLCIASRVYLWV